MSLRLALACLILPLVLLVPACGQDSPLLKPQADTGVALQGDFSGTGPGTLLDARTLPTLDRRMRAATSIAARVEYTSTSGVTNSETQVTGTVFAPKGPAPEGGWPIVAIGHASSGIETNCAPSLSPSLQGLASLVALLIQGGYVVTVPDYQGLGTHNSYHPYLEPNTEGYNLIDGARAARKLVPDTSDRWMAIGFSQGGQAAWAANELAATYGKGLTLVGSISLAPPLDLTFLADAAASGTLTKDQKALYPGFLASLGNEHPDLNLDDYRHGTVAQNWDSLLRCGVVETEAHKKLVEQMSADDLRPSSQAATDALRGYLQKMSLPQRPTAAPMLVIYGDNDALIPFASTDRALAEACRLGDVIQFEKQPGKGHGDLDLATALPWVADRFKDAPVTNSCGSPLPPGAPHSVAR